VDLTNPDLHQGETLMLAKDTVYVTRMKFLWNAACYELVAFRNFGDEPLTLRVDFDFDADFADLFEVRGFKRASRGRVTASVGGPSHVVFDYASQDQLPRRTEIHFDPPPRELRARHATLELELAPKQRRSIALTVHCLVGDARPQRGALRALRGARRDLRGATRRAAAVTTSSSLVNEILCRSMADISMLVTDTEHGPYPYAGVPWFSTAFGRDGILTAMQLLWLYPAMARGVLRYLAASQADEEDPERDAEPGKILHETRKCELALLKQVPFGRYYGSIDSTPLFVALAGMYWQYTADTETLQAIWPNVKAALRWIDAHGDADGDGFVEYRRRRDSGLVNQGWKDSGDAVFHEDGRLAEAPIALCEVQGYVYLARTLAARMAEARGEMALATSQSERAKALKERFEAEF
jgi:glycogen debranching enzyme